MSDVRAVVRVIALGAWNRGDDELGPLVANWLARRRFSGIRVTSGLSDPLAVATVLGSDCDVVVIDALRDPTRAVGSVVVWKPSTVLPIGGELRISTHGNALESGLAIARTLGIRPSSLTICGVVGGRFGLGQPISPAVGDALPNLYEKIEALLRALTNQSTAVPLRGGMT